MKNLSEELGPVADAIKAADSAFGAGAGQGMVDGMEADGFGLAQGQWHQSLSDDQNEDWMKGHRLRPEYYLERYIYIYILYIYIYIYIYTCTLYIYI